MDYINETGELTPIQEAEDGILLKRDDLFACEAEGYRVRGGKVRACQLIAAGAKGLTTASHRSSPQQCIVAVVAKHLGVPCVIHTAAGEPTNQQEFALAAGAEYRRYKAGYSNVISARANECAAKENLKLIPFGMESLHQIRGTAAQVANLPAADFKRIVIAMGSGMSVAGVLLGLEQRGIKKPVLGVRIGADPAKVVNKYISPSSRRLLEIVQPDAKYSDKVDASIGGIILDQVYEAKTAEFLEAGDLLWVVGVRPATVADPALSLQSAL